MTKFPAESAEKKESLYEYFRGFLRTMGRIISGRNLRYSLGKEIGFPVINNSGIIYDLRQII